ncbi:hypothetical protein QBC40DRAFT_278440 [Triangularia verruculosa]|uniref:Mid2 domain-containing protein n=1 Tax=Triangularia verruculosa TaxID=2587418 RepID=A0AAN7AU56_9PEZI|nr:hypothetical protein QBC40DRAFT_278440 [Triangularia verruculosa]
MRILTRRACVAVICLASGVVNGQEAASPIGNGNDDKLDAVIFDINDFIGPEFGLGQTAIFFPQSPMNRTFTWTSPNYGVVVTIQLWQKIESKIIEDQPDHKSIISAKVRPDNPKEHGEDVHDGSSNTLASVVNGPSPSSTIGQQPTVARRQPKGTNSCDNLLSAAHSGGGGSVTVDLLAIRQFCGHKLTGNNPLYFKAIWGRMGDRANFSRAFAVVINTDELEEAKTNSIYQSTDPYVPPGDAVGYDTENMPGGLLIPTSGADGSISTPTSELATPDSASRTGLELGAIIGIAVGCGLAGLLTVLGIIWFVVRRRQQKQDLRPVGSFNSGNRGEDLMAEKEAHTGVDVDASPNSPYSDDGHGNVAYPPGTTAATVALAATTVPSHPDQSRSYTPYSDRPGAGARATPSIRPDSIALNDEGARTNVPSPIPGRATPRGLTTPYAHLVEEGMTEEEIRRLEEEERQLDAAIEQAGRR